MTRVAAVDCGTNSIRLLIADLNPAAGTLRDLHRQMEIVRLGEGVDRTKALSPAALERTTGVLRTYAAIAARLGAERVRMIATSATRDAVNRDEFVARCRAILGTDPEVVTGEEEARLSFVGATRELDPAAAPYLVVDVGGGSTEFVLGERDVRAACSVDVGCVRIMERHFADDPPTATQIAAARADVEAALDLAAAAVPLGQARTLVGVAGTVTTLTAAALRLDRYDPARIHLARVPADAVHRTAAWLLGLPRAERAALPYMHPGRVDIIGAGGLIWSAVVERVGLAEAVASEHDILDGIAWSLVSGDSLTPG